MTTIVSRTLARHAVAVRTVTTVTIADDPLGRDRVLRSRYLILPSPLLAELRALAHGDGSWRCPGCAATVGHYRVPSRSRWEWAPTVIVAEDGRVTTLCVECGRLPRVEGRGWLS